MLRIGTLLLQKNWILAPLSGVSDLPFRMLNRRFGCEMAFVEMINVRALGERSPKTARLLTCEKDERPVGIQLLAGEPGHLQRGLGIVRRYRFDLIDFNAACPARKVTRRGEGAALMTDLARLAKLLKLLVRESASPVSVKLRAGWDASCRNAVDAARCAQDAGVAAVFLHGRTRTQEYAGGVDYDIIRQAKKALRVPLIASGDIFSASLARRMIEETGCDGLLVARGAFGNPWIFRELEQTAAWRRPNIEEIVSVMREHFGATEAFYGARVSVTIFRKFFAWYTKGMRGVRVLREKANHVRCAAGMYAVIDECRLCRPAPVPRDETKLFRER